MVDKLPHNIALQHAYDQLWLEAREDIARGEVLTDPVPGHRSGSTRWGIALVLRPDAAVRTRMEEAVALFRPLIGEQHIFYDASNLHTTIRVYEYYRESVSMDDPEIRRYAEITQAVADRFASFQLRYLGLTATMRGILAQGYPLTGALQHFRQQLRDQLAEADLAHGPEQYVARNTVHSSLCVFNGPLLRPQEIYEFIERERTRELGLTTVTELEIVHYQRTEYTVMPINLTTIKLVV
jgi:hypothetical protein